MQIKFLFIFLIFFFLAYSHQEEEYLKLTEIKDQITAIANALPDKYCPMRDFNGQLFCPSTKFNNFEQVFSEDDAINVFNQDSHVSFGISEEGLLKLKEHEKEHEKKPQDIEKKPIVSGYPQVISGFGFDRITREIKFPALPSNPAAYSPRQEHTVKKYNGVTQFLQDVLGIDQKGYFEAGLYAHQLPHLRNIALNFGDYRIDMGVTQKLFTTHVSNVQSRSPLVEFAQVAASLPPYDPNNGQVRELYQMVIKFWGTDVSLSTQHGGVVYQQTLIKACFGGQITADMIKDIEAAIAKLPPGGMAYINYRRLGLFDIRGGNPEYGSSRTAERIASFANAPAPLRFSTVPLWQLAPTANSQAWLRQAIDEYIRVHQPSVNQVIAEVEHIKRENYKNTQELQLFFGNVEQHAWLILYAQGCGYRQTSKSTLYTPFCTIRRLDLWPHQYLKAGQISAKLYYDVYVERDPTTGYGRIRRNNYIGPWLASGCHSFYIPFIVYIGRAQYYFNNHIHMSFCINCLPVIAQSPAPYNCVHTSLQCHCPAF